MKNLKSTNEAHESSTPAMTAFQSFFPEFERNDFADCTAIVQNLTKLPTLVSIAETDPKMNRLRGGEKEVAVKSLAEVPTPESLDNAAPLEDFTLAMAMCLAINGLFE